MRAQVEEKLPEVLNSDKDKRRNEAAVKIQRRWRASQRNRFAADALSPDARWQQAAVHAKMKLGRMSADKGHNSPKERWQRTAFFASRLAGDRDEITGDANKQPADPQLKNLETQHWLELVDGKHRYGSNLKYYFAKWKQSDTNDNFFKWLDKGEGKDLSLPECSREQLEKERIIYLSAEQRMNYLVKIDEQGKLRWARNNTLVDTTAGRWKDAGGGAGIVPLDVPERPPLNGGRGSFSSSLSSSSASSDEAVTHYVGEVKGRNRFTRSIRRKFTPSGWVQKLLRKTVARNTWVYVADAQCNIFIGIKTTGEFQHSSLVGGGPVMSAGLISVDQGLIKTLSPLSGHYRTRIGSFHHFLHELEKRGVNMKKVKVTKAEAALWGIEHLGKWQKKQKGLQKKGKEEVKDAATKVKMAVTTDDSWKKEVLEGRKRNEEQAAAQENGHATDTEDKGKQSGSDEKGEQLGSEDKGKRPEDAPATKKDESVPEEQPAQEGKSTPPADPPAEDASGAESAKERGHTEAAAPAANGESPPSPQDSKVGPKQPESG